MILLKDINPKIVFVYETDNDGKAEKDLKLIFKNKFTLRKDFGREFYTGNIEEMKLSIIKYFMNNDIESEEEKEDDEKEDNEDEKEDDEELEINTYEDFIKLSSNTFKGNIFYFYYYFYFINIIY